MQNDQNSNTNNNNTLNLKKTYTKQVCDASETIGNGDLGPSTSMHGQCSKDFSDSFNAFEVQDSTQSKLNQYLKDIQKTCEDHILKHGYAVFNVFVDSTLNSPTFYTSGKNTNVCSGKKEPEHGQVMEDDKVKVKEETDVHWSVAYKTLSLYSESENQEVSSPIDKKDATKRKSDETTCEIPLKRMKLEDEDVLKCDSNLQADLIHYSESSDRLVLLTPLHGLMIMVEYTDPFANGTLSKQLRNVIALPASAELRITVQCSDKASFAQLPMVTLGDCRQVFASTNSDLRIIARCNETNEVFLQESASNGRKVFGAKFHDLKVVIEFCNKNENLFKRRQKFWRKVFTVLKLSSLQVTVLC